MSTITKERVANLLQFNSEGSNCQANAEQWEVHELARIALEHAAEIDRLKKLVIRVPMPVVVPADIIHSIKVNGAFAMGIERYGDAMMKLAKKEDGNG